MDETFNITPDILLKLIKRERRAGYVWGSIGMIGALYIAAAVKVAKKRSQQGPIL